MLKEYMLSLGYTDAEIDTIVNSHGLKGYRKETLYEKIKDIYGFLVDYGYDGKDVIKITTSIPQILCLSVTSIANRLDYMIRLSYTKLQVIKMTKSFPVILCLSEDNLDKKIKDMLELGYSNGDIIKMTVVAPRLYSFTIVNIKQKIDDIMKLGYTREEVIGLARGLPELYCFSVDNIKKKIKDIMDLGFTLEEVLRMTVSFPKLFGCNIDKIREKKEFYDLIGISEVMVRNPKHIMQSVEVSYARYIFLHSRGVVINMENYRKLFKGEKAFFQENGITKEELLQLYNYDEYLEKQGKVRNRIKKK